MSHVFSHVQALACAVFFAGNFPVVHKLSIPLQHIRGLEEGTRLGDIMARQETVWKGTKGS